MTTDTETNCQNGEIYYIFGILPTNVWIENLVSEIIFHLGQYFPRAWGLKYAILPRLGHDLILPTHAGIESRPTILVKNWSILPTYVGIVNASNVSSV